MAVTVCRITFKRWKMETDESRLVDSWRTTNKKSTNITDRHMQRHKVKFMPYKQWLVRLFAGLHGCMCVFVCICVHFYHHRQHHYHLNMHSHS